MKVDKFAVSVQYGGGLHYFRAYFATATEAYLFAETEQERADARRARLKDRGAAPTTYVWRLRLSRNKQGVKFPEDAATS